jgi:hypothetical protein
VHLHYSKVPYVIDTAANGATMSTHFWGTTRTWAGGDNAKWVMLVRDGVLYVPEAQEDLMSLGKVTQFSFKAIIHAGILELKYADASRADEVAITITAVNDVFPFLLRSADRTDEEAEQVNGVLRAHGKAKYKACIAFPRVVTAKHDGEEDFKSGQGQGYINHCKLGHRSGAPGRIGLADIQPGTCASCVFTGMVDLKEPDDGRRTAEFPLQIMAVDAQGPYVASIRGHRFWVCVVDVCTKYKMSFPAPTLTEALKTLDYVIKRESNRLNRDVASVFQRWYEPRKLDVAVASEGLQPDSDLAEGAKDVEKQLAQFDGMEGYYVKLSVLKARPVTVGILRLDAWCYQPAR